MTVHNLDSNSHGVQIICCQHDGFNVMAMDNFTISCQLLTTPWNAHGSSHKRPRTSRVHPCYAFLPIDLCFNRLRKDWHWRLVSFSFSQTFRYDIAYLLIPVALYLALHSLSRATVPFSTLILAVSYKVV